MSNLYQLQTYPIGRPGHPWNAEERAAWLKKCNVKQRDYFTDVVSPLFRYTCGVAKLFQYGELDYRQLVGVKYPLYAVRSEPWNAELPLIVITGGVHGNESSGIHGALRFIFNHFAATAALGSANLLVLPCISPWGYEVKQRWTPEAIDPNRQFNPSAPAGSCCPEAASAMCVIHEWSCASTRVLLHVDLHETTDTGITEFRAAEFARDGKPLGEAWASPYGFYTVSDANRPEPEFQAVVVSAAAQHTQIAAGDEKGTIIGVPLAQRGVVSYPGVNLCGNHTPAKYVTTTEVYPHGEFATDEDNNELQTAVVNAAIAYALAFP